MTKPKPGKGKHSPYDPEAEKVGKKWSKDDVPKPVHKPARHKKS